MPINGRILNIPANIGVIAIPLCKLIPGIRGKRAIGIEASPGGYKYRQHNLAINSPIQYTVLNNAVTENDDEKLTFYSPDVMFGKGSQSNAYSSSSHSVRSVTIDTLAESYFNSSVDVIKIDIEGYEYFAFKGGVQLLTKTNAPVILFESLEWAEAKSGVQPGSAQKFLMDYGYTLYMIENNKKQLLEKPVQTGDAMLLAIKDR